jgi:hypothetical protein
MSDYASKWGAMRPGMGSMGEHEFRRKARSYLAAARAMKDNDAKAALLDMAARYMELAQQDTHIAGLVEHSELLTTKKSNPQ